MYGYVVASALIEWYFNQLNYNPKESGVLYKYFYELFLSSLFFSISNLNLPFVNEKNVYIYIYICICISIFTFFKLNIHL